MKSALIILLGLALIVVINAQAAAVNVFGGDFQKISPTVSQQFAIWNIASQTWRDVKTTPPGTITAWAYDSNTTIYLAISNGGRGIVYRYDGDNYHNIGYSFSSDVNWIFVNGPVLYVCGNFNWLVSHGATASDDEYAVGFATFSTATNSDATIRGRWEVLGRNNETLRTGATPEKVFVSTSNTIFCLGSDNSLYYLIGSQYWDFNHTNAQSNIMENSRIFDVWYRKGAFYAYGFIQLVGNTMASIIITSPNNDGKTWTEIYANSTVLADIVTGTLVVTDNNIYFASRSFYPNQVVTTTRNSLSAPQPITTSSFSNTPSFIREYMTNPSLLLNVGGGTVSSWNGGKSDQPSRYNQILNIVAGGFVQASLSSSGSPVWAEDLGGGVDQPGGVQDVLIGQSGGTDTEVLVRGNINVVYDQMAYGLASYHDDNTFLPLGNPLRDAVNGARTPGASAGSIKTLVFDSVNQVVYFGGIFATINNETYNSIASYTIGSTTPFAAFPGTAATLNGPTGLTFPDTSSEFDIPGTVNAIELYDNSGDTVLVVGGSFSQSFNTPLRNIATYSTTNAVWSALGAGIDGTIYAIHVDGDSFYVGGEFTIAGHVYSPNIALWDNTNSVWVALGTGVTGIVFDIESYDGNIYVAGSITSAGGRRANGVAYWDGNNWYAQSCNLCGVGCQDSTHDWNTCFNGNTVYELRYITGQGLFVRADAGLFFWNGNNYVLQNEADVSIPTYLGRILSDSSPDPNHSGITTVGVSSSVHFSNNLQLGAYDIGSKNWKYIQKGGFDGNVNYVSSAITIKPFLVLIALFAVLVLFY